LNFVLTLRGSKPFAPRTAKINMRMTPTKKEPSEASDKARLASVVRLEAPQHSLACLDKTGEQSDQTDLPH
jgi:hypothetical protein